MTLYPDSGDTWVRILRVWDIPGEINDIDLVKHVETIAPGYSVIVGYERTEEHFVAWGSSVVASFRLKRSGPTNLKVEHLS